MIKLALTQQQLQAILRYEPDTGWFTWLVRPSMCVAQGARAGGVNNKGYRMISIKGALYAEHRLAWLYMTGSWPSDQVDHINGVRSENKWANLREATNITNNQNYRKARSDSRTGLMGVKPHGNKFWARIVVDGVRRSVGHFATAQQAHSAYLTAKRQHHEGCTI